MKVGQVCVKLAGRDAGEICVVVDELEKNFVLIDGNTRRRKCNISHLEPMDSVLKIKKKATNSEVFDAMKKAGLGVIESKKREKRTKKEKPARKRKVKAVKEEKKKDSKK